MTQPDPQSEHIRVAIVDDHAMFRDSLAMALERADDVEIVGAAGSAAEAERTFAGIAIDVALLDYALPDGSGVEVADALHRRDPSPRTLILTANEGPQAAAEAIAAGCTGYLRKTADVPQLLRAVRLAAAGEALFDNPTLSAAIAWLNRSERAPTVALTDREMDVLRLLAEGRSAVDISEALYLSQHTVRNHIRSTLSKLDARSQLEAVVIGASLGLVEVGRPELREEED